MKGITFRKIRFFTLFAACAMLAFGQSADTGILGTITDPSGSVIAGATVTISSSAIGFSKSVVTNSEGEYELRYLLPEDYVVEVRSAGFRPERTEGITLRMYFDKNSPNEHAEKLMTNAKQAITEVANHIATHNGRFHA